MFLFQTGKSRFRIRSLLRLVAGETQTSLFEYVHNVSVTSLDLTVLQCAKRHLIQLFIPIHLHFQHFTCCHDNASCYSHLIVKTHKLVVKRTPFHQIVDVHTHFAYFLGDLPVRSCLSDFVSVEQDALSHEILNEVVGSHETKVPSQSHKNRFLHANEEVIVVRVGYDGVKFGDTGEIIIDILGTDV